MNISPNIVFVDSQTELSSLIEVLTNLDDKGVIALDTEFMRVSTYYPVFALLQLNINGISYLLDPISMDLSKLIERLNKTEATVLIFASLEDLEVISHYAREHNISPLLPKKIVDLQLLAAFLNLSYSQGLSKSISLYLGTELPKNATRSDWEQRPLSPEQLSYASDDVFYLKELYDVYMSKALKNDIRVRWFYKAMEDFKLQCIKEVDVDEIYLNLQGAGALTNLQLQRLSYLAKKRENYAKENNIALSRIAPSKSLVAICVSTPLTFQGLAGCGVKWGAIHHYGKMLIGWIKETLDFKGDPTLKTPYDSVVSTRHGSKQYKRLKFILNSRAERAAIRSELLLTKSLCYDYLFNKKIGQKALLEGSWYYECVGEIDYKDLSSEA